MTLKQFLEALTLRLVADPSIEQQPMPGKRLDFEPTWPGVHQRRELLKYESEEQDMPWEA
jgi:hypothetical protein